MNSPDDSEITYLTANELYSINEEVTGELPYVRDRHSLQYAARRPYIMVFGQEQFPTLLEKAAALMDSLAHNHLFGDGNKRTAIRAVTMFLEANGVQPAWSEADAMEFVLSVAKGEQTVETILAWLEQNTK
jgi:death-on-curing protein